MRKAILLFSMVVALSGCEPPTIDASSDEALKSSMSKVRSSLPEERRAKFDEAVQVLALSQVDFKSLLAGGQGAGALVASKMIGELAGKNADQVISEAERVLSERRAREREQALAEIKELQERQAQAERAKQQLQNIVVSRSRFYKRKRPYRVDEPVIDVTVRNGTDTAISRIYFEGVIASPNRSVPWLKENFNYSISGGLEPGEEQSWSLAPNSFSEWGKVDAPPDAVLTVTVVRVDDAEGQALFSSRDFGEREERRLAELTARYMH